MSTVNDTAAAQRLTVSSTTTAEQLTVSSTTTAEQLTVSSTTTAEQLTVSSTTTAEQLTVSSTTTAERPRWRWLPSWRLVLGLVTLVAAVVLVRRLEAADLGARLRSADLTWVGVALALSTLPVIGNSISLMALTPGRLSFRRTAGVQLATSFVNLVTPASAGGLALNVRYLQRTGVPLAVAVTVVGITQSSAVLVTAALVVMLLLGSGRFTAIGSALPWQAMVIAVVLLVLGGVALRVLPSARAWLHRLLVAPAQDSWPQLRATLLNPTRAGVAAIGHIMVTLGFVGVLAASARAFGGDPSIVLLTLVIVGSSAVAGVTPVPGGIGTFEAALTAGLVTIGLDAGMALSAALLFRLITFWSRVPIGWLCLLYLRHRQAI